MSRRLSTAWLAVALDFAFRNPVPAMARPGNIIASRSRWFSPCTRAKIRGAAAHKRAARKRRNIARRASK